MCEYLPSVVGWISGWEESGDTKGQGHMVFISLRLEMPNCTGTYKHVLLHSSPFQTSTYSFSVAPSNTSYRPCLCSQCSATRWEKLCRLTFHICSSNFVKLQSQCDPENILANGWTRKPEWQHLWQGLRPWQLLSDSPPWMPGRDLNLDPFAVFPQNSNRNVLRKCSYGTGNAWNIRWNPHFS